MRKGKRKLKTYYFSSRKSMCRCKNALSTSPLPSLGAKRETRRANLRRAIYFRRIERGPLLCGAGCAEQRWKSLELSLGKRFRQKNPLSRSLYAKFSLERATASTIPSSGALAILANVGRGDDLVSSLPDGLLSQSF